MRIAPDELRYLALNTMENCVSRRELGGYTTNAITDALDWIVDSETDFPDNLDLPPYITFLTASKLSFLNIIDLTMKALEL